MPTQAKANKLELEDIPTDLFDLNPLEQLIYLRNPFMKKVALPSRKQRAIHGPAVNVPTDLTDTLVHPTSETAIPSSDGAHGAEEEAVL